MPKSGMRMSSQRTRHRQQEWLMRRDFIRPDPEPSVEIDKEAFDAMILIRMPVKSSQS
jgi:hypothetical protein